MMKPSLRYVLVCAMLLVISFPSFGQSGDDHARGLGNQQEFAA